MSKNRILVIEDDKDIADSIGLNLELSGYDYTIIDDGLEAAKRLSEDHSFDLALLDVMLPGLNGFALMEHLQRYNIPVIYLTAKADVPSRIKGLKIGAEDYIVKPFSVLELLVRIEKVLDRAGKLNKVPRHYDRYGKAHRNKKRRSRGVATAGIRSFGQAYQVQKLHNEPRTAAERNMGS